MRDGQVQGPLVLARGIEHAQFVLVKGLSPSQLLPPMDPACLAPSDPFGFHLLRAVFPMTKYVLLSYCCCNKLAQTTDFTEIYHLTVLEVRVQSGSHWAKVQVWAGLDSFWRLQGRTVPLPSLAYRHCPHSLIFKAGNLGSVFIVTPSFWFSCLPLLLKRTLAILLDPPG